MARTTLDLDKSVLEDLRRRGREEGKSIGRVASEMLAAAAAEAERGKGGRTPFEWRTASLGEPRIDLEDKEAVRALLDRDG